MNTMIHIIEDDIDILTILNIFFKRKGFNVIADYNGNDFDATKEPCPQIYLIDINLMGKNGLDLCKIIKKECSHVPVVLMSANIQLEQMAKECKADAFISKPFDMDTVYSTIKAIVA